MLEYIDGIDLSKVIKGLNGIHVEYNRVIAAQLCMALKYLHYKGFIHRDVKVKSVLSFVNDAFMQNFAQTRKLNPQRRCLIRGGRRESSEDDLPEKIGKSGSDP